MHINNINRNITPLKGFNTWHSWYNYVETLNTQTQSIYNYLYYLNPDYKIINSPNWKDPWTEEDLIDKGFQKLIIVRIPTKRWDDIAGEWVIDYIEQNVMAFFPAKLTYRQGFLNLQDTDVSLLLYTKEEDSDHYVYLLDTHDKLAWEELSEGTYYITMPNNYQLNDIFPSGYCCISNVQPTGEDNEFADIKHNLSSYLIYPLGNGGFYNWDFYNTSLNASFRANELANLSNTNILNFSLSTLRFCNYADSLQFDNKLSLNAFAGYFINDGQIQPQIADWTGNVWTGQENLQYDLFTNDYELVFMDTEYQLDSRVTKLYQQPILNIKHYHDIINLELRLSLF